MDDKILSERETLVLETIIRNYILTAEPTGSRFIAKQKGFDVSAATIRNIMGDLEEKGFIAQPHTSAGRVPTDFGYRYYVDLLIQSVQLPDHIQYQIRHEIAQVEPSDLHKLLDVTSKALSKATDQLGIIFSPRLCSGIFRHMHIYEIGLHRFMMYLTIDSGFVKTLVAEIATELSQQQLEAVSKIMNERFFGKSLQELFLKEEEPLLTDVGLYEINIIKMFIPSIQKMLKTPEAEEVACDGEAKMLMKQDFSRREDLDSIVEILGEKSLLMHLFNARNVDTERVVVTIGGEIGNDQFSSFSIVKTRYRIGNMQGCLGIIGPKRMQYPYLISAVEYTSRVLSDLY
jgi:heat-inducible transcriptional repressor